MLQRLSGVIRHIARNAVQRAVDLAIFPETKGSLRRRLDASFLATWRATAFAAANPFLRNGAKYFSQADEDGLLLEIVKRLAISEGTFAEIGVGKGLENNTIILLMCGWRGLWIGSEHLAFPSDNLARLTFLQAWVTPDKAAGYVSKAMAEGVLPAAGPDVLSLDIDSFDLHVMAAILGLGVRPKVLVVEYNGKFPPPVRFSVNVGETWDGSDYMGCSLQSWCDLLGPAGYELIVCNVTGTNAFFISHDVRHLFPEVPTDIAALFMPCNYQWFVQVGHKTSPRTIQHFANR